MLCDATCGCCLLFIAMPLSSLAKVSHISAFVQITNNRGFLLVCENFAELSVTYVLVFVLSPLPHLSPMSGCLQYPVSSKCVSGPISRLFIIHDYKSIYNFAASHNPWTGVIRRYTRVTVIYRWKQIFAVIITYFRSGGQRNCGKTSHPMKIFKGKCLNCQF